MNNNFSFDLKAKYDNFSLNASFNVEKGEFVSIIGPSGCGKSTTLQLITGLIEMKEGRVNLLGEDVINLDVHKRNIAMVFQDYALFPHMNVYKNIAFPLKQRKYAKSEIEGKVKKLLDFINLSGFENRKIEGLSGGEKQRIAIARAIASEPKILLLDEPLSALDAKLRTYLRKEIKDLQKKTGITTIYVTHDQEEALSLSDRIIVMNDGKIEQIGKPEEVYNYPSNLFVAKFMGEGNTLPKSDKNDESLLFFRPEDVLINSSSDCPSLELKGAKLIESEYLGSCYKNIFNWKGFVIFAISQHKININTATLTIKNENIREYLNDILVVTKS